MIMCRFVHVPRVIYSSFIHRSPRERELCGQIIPDSFCVYGVLMYNLVKTLLL